MRISVNTSGHQYPVIIEPNSVRKFKFPKNSIVITDTTLKKKYGNWFKQYPLLTFTPGEHSKHLSTVEQLCSQLVKLDADRTSSIIAFGGGVVGDIAGFVASIYMRGIPVYQVPTSLLAMVDASVGGKTGVDLPEGKNLVGSFHQPQAVVIDSTFLVDLPSAQFSNGMGEVIKHGLIDEELFKWLEKNKQKIAERDIPTLQRMLAKNIQIKQAVVEADEKESGVRMMLNLGHTFGHAIEKLSGYSVPHGQAVAIGLVYAASYSKMPEIESLISMLHYFGLPSHLEQPYTAAQMVTAMQSDKKNNGKHITLVLPKRIGEVHIYPIATSTAIKSFIKKHHQAIN